MTDDRTDTGLCMNCLNASQCAYRIRHTRPVIFCEEFVCTVPQKTIFSMRSLPKNAEPAFKQVADKSPDQCLT